MARKTKDTELPLGWCMDGHCDKCPGEIVSMGKKIICNHDCEDHGVNHVVLEGASPLLLDVMERHGFNKK